MPLQRLVPSPPPVVSDHDRSRFVAALGRLGDRSTVILHRVAVVDGVRVAYDAWSPNSELSGECALAYAMQGLDDHELSWPGRRWRNSFSPSRQPGVLEAWFYDDRQLLGRVLLLNPGNLRTVALRKCTCALTLAWQRLVQSDQAQEQHGTIVTDAAGMIQAYDSESSSVLAGGPGFAKAIAAAVCSGDGPALLVCNQTAIFARPLEGPTPMWIVKLEAAAPVLLAPDAELTPTQREVAAQAAAGATVDEIADSLNTANNTVRSHIKEVYRRLDVANRVELLRALTTT